MKFKRHIVLYSMLFFVIFFYIWLSFQISNTEVSVEGWGYNTTRDTSQYILTNLSAHIFPEHFCDHESFLLVVVCSGPSNWDARNAIRETWGHERLVLGNNVSFFFLLGENLNSSLQEVVRLESEKFGDIIVERFMDSYNNLTIKSVVMLKLVSSYCANSTKYLLKIDDDMFVNVPHIVQMLVDRNRTNDLLMGHLICGARPIKDSSSKWYSPQYMYSGRVYPHYLSGTGYLMSVDVAEKLYKEALRTPIFHLEDVFVTGMCAQKAKVRRRNNPLFTYQKLSHDLCVFNRLLTIHRLTPADIRRTYAGLKDETLAKECSLARNNFNVNQWLMQNILKVNKTYRKSKCG